VCYFRGVVLRILQPSRQRFPLKCRYNSTILHGVTSRKTDTFVVNAARTSNFRLTCRRKMRFVQEIIIKSKYCLSETKWLNQKAQKILQKNWNDCVQFYKTCAHVYRYFRISTSCRNQHRISSSISYRSLWNDGWMFSCHKQFPMFPKCLRVRARVLKFWSVM
jgi:hypothetical protein